MVLTFYFTSTGNCLYVAKRISKGQLISIPQALKEDRKIFKDDSIGFVFPCYGFGVPKIVQKFMKLSAFEANYIFTVMTYGNIAANGLGHMEKLGLEANIKFDYTAEILMVDNYLPVYRMEDQLKKEPSKNIEANLDIIVQDIGQKSSKKVKKGAATKLATSLIQMIEPLRKGDVDSKFSVNDKCTRCGVCEKVCPKGNISIKKDLTYLHNCDFCMGCINLCPENAIHLKGQKSEVRFKNQHVKLKEIITANNQLL